MNVTCKVKTFIRSEDTGMGCPVALSVLGSPSHTLILKDLWTFTGLSMDPTREQLCLSLIRVEILLEREHS